MELEFVTVYCYFTFTEPAAPRTYTLSLHDALPISWAASRHRYPGAGCAGLTAGIRRGHRRRSSRSWCRGVGGAGGVSLDRKSTRLNSSHTVISYAVFCLKKKTKRCSVILASFRALI